MTTTLWFLVVLLAIGSSGLVGFYLGLIAGQQLGEAEAEDRIGRTQAERTEALLRAGRSKRKLREAGVR